MGTCSGKAFQKEGLAFMEERAWWLESIAETKTTNGYCGCNIESIREYDLC